MHFIFQTPPFSASQGSVSRKSGTELRWPTTVTSKYNSSRQNKICHGKIQCETEQIQITPGKLQTLTAKTKTVIAIQNSSRQEQNAHGKSKTLTAIAKQSRQKQNAHGKIKSRIVVSGCPSTWCRVSPGLHIRQDVDFLPIFPGLLSVLSILEVQKHVLFQICITYQPTP